MNTKIKFVMICAVLVITILVAAILYNNLSGQYAGGNLETNGYIDNQDTTDFITKLNADSMDTAEPLESADSNDSPEASGSADLDNDTETITESTADTIEDQSEHPEDESHPVYHYPEASDFAVLDANGDVVNLSDFRGTPVVLNFWATWCYYCKEEMPDFQKAFEKYSDVKFMMVNATDGHRETVDSAKEYIEKEGYSFEVFFDTEGSAIEQYQIAGFPTTFFIDKYGRIVAYGTGMLDYETLEEAISMIAE